MTSVLLIEDDPLTRKLVESLLAPHAELDVRYVDSAEAAVEAVTAKPAEFVVCDLYLPKKDGLQLAEELSRIAPARFFFMGAGHAGTLLRERVQQEFRAPIFVKPLELLELVNALLAAVHSEEPLVASDSLLPELGSLAERPTPQLLLDLWEGRRSGLLDLARGRVHKQVVLRKGAPVAVASNLRGETLGHFLVQRGKITDAQHQQAIGQSQKENERLGRILVRLGFLDEQQLLDELAAQMRHKLVHTLRWPDGTFRFEPGEPRADKLELPFETPRLVFSGLRRTARLDDIVPRLREVPARLTLTLRAERHRPTLGKMFGEGGLAPFDARPLTSELVAHADAAKLLVQADVLLRSGCAELESLGADASATPARDPLALVELGKERHVTAPAPRSTEDGLFADPETGPHILLDPDDDDTDDSGVFPMPGAPGLLTPEQLRAQDPAGEALRKEVLAEYLALHAKDHYQLLGVARDAAPQDIALAHAALSRRFRFERFADVELGRDYARLEEIAARIKLAYETLSNKARREVYDQALGAPEIDKREGRLEAEVLSHQGQAKLARGEHAAAKQKLELAVAADPEQPDYHALLGWATYLAALGPAPSASLERTRAAAAQARPHLETALQIDPDHTDAHEMLGRIDTAEGDDGSAADHLELVLDHAPTRAEVLTLAEAALGRRGEWQRLEQLYRRLIHRLANDATERPLLVWWRLAELYRTRLDDAGAAQVAYETVARLAPDDPRPRRALALLLHSDPDNAQELAVALREAWRLEPEDATPGLDLFHAQIVAERWDAALVTAMALACRGASDADAAQFLRAHRPRFLVRAQDPINGGLFDSLRHPGDEITLGALFADVFAVSAPDITLASLDVDASSLVERGAMPDAFGRALVYAAHELGVEAPEVYARHDFGAEVHLGATRPPVLLVGPQALASTDLLLLTFRISRALSYARNGRALTAALPTRELKEHLGAALTLAQPGMHFPDPEGRIAQLRAKLSGRATSLARTLQPQVEKLLSGAPERINLSRFVAAMGRTADRIGLVLCNDLVTAARVVGEECAPGAEDELLDFALGDVYLEARRRLGLAVAV